jgi:Flp pilus assembly protein CpaB
MQRLSPGTLILGIFAVLFALVGVFGLKKYLQEQKVQAVAPAKVEKKEVPQSVPVAVVDIPAGRTITYTDVMTLSLTEQEIKGRKLQRPWMGRAMDVIGRTLRQEVKQGQPFDPKAFYPLGIGPDVAAKLKPGERAVSIAREGSVAPIGLITPGAVVDVLFRCNLDPKRKLPEASVTLVSGVRVLAVGQNTLEGTTGETGSPVILAVNERQARALEVVEGCGTLTLLLRNGKDTRPAEQIPPTTLPGLFGYQPPPAPFATQIYRRGRLTTATFQDGQQQSLVTEPPYGMPVTEPAQPSAPDSSSYLQPARQWRHGQFPGGGDGRGVQNVAAVKDS